MRKHPVENPELVQMDASIHAIIRRAYDMGRSDALNRVVDVLNLERPCADRLALMAPGEGVGSPASEPEATPEAIEVSANGSEAPRTGAPWWAWPIR